jgi:hypothetical protein
MSRAKEQLTQVSVGNLTSEILKFKTADQSYTTQTALQSDTDLSYSIAENEIWAVRFMLDVGAALATPGLKLSVSVPSGAVVNVVAGMIPDTVTAANVTLKRSAVASATLTFAAAGLVGVGDSIVEMMAYVKNGATAGTVQLQFCQATSSGTAITLRKGSWMDARKAIF